MKAVYGVKYFNICFISLKAIVATVICIITTAFLSVNKLALATLFVTSANQKLPIEGRWALKFKFKRSFLLLIIYSETPFWVCDVIILTDRLLSLWLAMALPDLLALLKVIWGASFIRRLSLSLIGCRSLWLVCYYLTWPTIKIVHKYICHSIDCYLNRPIAGLRHCTGWGCQPIGVGVWIGAKNTASHITLLVLQCLLTLAMLCPMAHLHGLFILFYHLCSCLLAFSQFKKEIWPYLVQTLPTEFYVS